VFLVRPPTDDRLDRLLADMAGAELTYPEVGATAEPDALPAGYHHVRAATVLGAGDADFAAAVDGIRTWRLHRGQGIRVAPAEPPVAPGTDVALVVPSFGLHVVAACRVVWVVDDGDRFGFGYGTLPVHPASGEEAFVVDRVPGGDVRAAIVAFSRPRHPLARLGAPVMRRQQVAATDGYLDALRRHVAVSRDRDPGPSTP
jgi:uncharacterized protein (UPF0548 family)